MNKLLNILSLWGGLVGILLFSSCSKEFNHVYKYADSEYKYEYAKEQFIEGHYGRASSLLVDLVSYQKGKTRAEESLFMLGMSQFLEKDYEAASPTFSRYFSTYTKGRFAELAAFYKGESLYLNTPEPRLDQTDTYAAIKAFQDYLDVYPSGQMKEQVEDRLFNLQDKLVKKELYSAQLYYDLGHYFGNCSNGGNNYDACVITCQNALKDYPYTTYREQFSILIVRAKYELARMSVEERENDRFQDAMDEAYGFINEYPDSKNIPTAEKIIQHCSKRIKGDASGEAQNNN